MHYVVARAVHHVDAEKQELSFDYPDTVANLGKHCDLIDSWVQAKAWASVSDKLERATALVKSRVQSVLDARESIGPKFEEALLLALCGGTVELDDGEFKLLKLVCNGAGSGHVFVAYPKARLTPLGLMAFWPVLESLTIDVDEPLEAPPLEGWLVVELWQRAATSPDGVLSPGGWAGGARA